MMNKTYFYIERTAAILAAIILLQTLYFKFTGAQESIYIFSQLGLEPVGRIGVGVIELITGILLVIPKTALFGGTLGLGVISGALFFHFSILGFEIQGDGGLLFLYACLVFVSCIIVVFIRKKEIHFWTNWFRKQG